MVKKGKEVKTPDAQKDDALFEALGKNKKRKKRRIIIIVTSVLLILAALAVVGVGFLQRRVREQFASSQDEVLSYEASTGTINTVVSGSGTLSDVDLEYITVPEGVEITEVPVQTNDVITEGDILAKVDMASVVSVMADVQAEIESLDEQISEAEEDEASDTVCAGVSGRVKEIYAEKGTNVADTMSEHGALALISLDGYMALDIETDALAKGDSVTVIRDDGEELTGIVENVTGGSATVLVTDNGPKNKETVTVCGNDGEQIGAGELYIHSALRVMGYAGTVKSVSVDINDKVSDQTKLFSLEDTAYSANYKSLLRSRSEKEDTLLELLTIKRNSAVLAPFPGSVYSVDYSAQSEASVVTLSTDEKMSVTISVDESDILSLELGQEVTVVVNSVSEDGFSGILTEINRTSSSSGTYSAVVEMEKVDGMLSGMTASVSVKIEGVEDAILIPIEALHKTSDGAYVYTSYDEERQEYGGKVDVVTGLENSTYVEIKSGLNVGDTVYYTEAESAFGNFGGKGGFGSMRNFGGMGGFDGGEMPDFGGGEMPDFGGGQRPSGFPGRN